MEVNLTPDQQAFVRQAVASGRLRRPEDVVDEALALWEDRERTRSEILLAVDEAEEDIAAGDYREYTDATLSLLAEELKREVRESQD